MSPKIAANGFGRIGHSVLRALVESGETDVETVAINDLAPPATIAHLLKNGSVHGRLNQPVPVDAGRLPAGTRRIRLTAIRNPHPSCFAAAPADGMVRVVSWRDNAWGFANRMFDTGRLMGALIAATSSLKMAR